MLNTSLVEILKRLTSDEFKKFDEFVCSPYFNKKTPVTNLWKIIKKYSPEFESKKLDRKIIYSELFPGREFNYGVMKNLIFELTRLAENFLVTGSLQNNELLKKRELIFVLQEKGMTQTYKSKFENLKKKSLEMSLSNDLVREDYYFQMWCLITDKWNFDNQIMHSKNYDTKISQSSDYFIAFVLIKSFILYHNIEGQRVTHNYFRERSSVEEFLNSMHEKGIIEKIIGSVSHDSEGVSRVLKVYHKMFLSIIDKKSVEKYFEFKNLLAENSKLFSKNDLRALYITLSNCLSHLESRDIYKDKESLEIYDFRMSNNLLFDDDDQVWDQDIVRFISVAGSLEDVKKIESFMEKVISRMRDDTKENFLKFAGSHIYFIKKDYGKALELLASIKFDLFTMKFYVKNLQLKIYYELDEFNSFALSVDSYKHFLGNNKFVSQKMKNSNKLFCEITERLFEQKGKYDKNRFRELRDKIYRNYGKHDVWIVRKVQEIENKKT